MRQIGSGSGALDSTFKALESVVAFAKLERLTFAI